MLCLCLSWALASACKLSLCLLLLLSPVFLISLFIWPVFGVLVVSYVGWGQGLEVQMLCPQTFNPPLAFALCLTATLRGAWDCWGLQVKGHIYRIHGSIDNPPSKAYLKLLIQ